MQASVSNNETIKISAAASATTLASNQYAICTYKISNALTSGVPHFYTRYFGPGQTIPASTSDTSGSTITSDLVSGVIFENSP